MREINSLGVSVTEKSVTLKKDCNSCAQTLSLMLIEKSFSQGITATPSLEAAREDSLNAQRS